MPRRTGLPPGSDARAAALLAGELDPVATRDAATVLLLRDAPGRGVEAYLLRRRASMAFASGMHVFPGGGVDARDADGDVPWAGPAPGWWAERLGCDEALAGALVCAAVRETFEECGVLLAGASAEEVVGDVSDDGWEAARVALEARELALSDLLRERGLVLRSDLVRPFAHWVTPAFEARRYDTRFFVAALPTGQVARDVTAESDAVAWWRADEAAAAGADGRAAMLPPTLVSLEAVAGVASVAEALERPWPVARVEPRLVRDHDGALALEVDLP